MTAVDPTTLDTPATSHAAEAPPPPDADPIMVGVPAFLVGTIALGLTLLGYVPAAAAGAPVAIILSATALGLVIAAMWAARLGQSAVAGVFGIFAGFWLSYAVLVLGLTHNWFAVGTATSSTQGEFLISWLVIIVLLTIGTLRLPSAFTLLFALIDVALALVLAATLSGSAGLTRAGGVAVMAFGLVGVYIFLNSSSLATGGRGLPMGPPILR